MLIIGVFSLCHYQLILNSANLQVSLPSKAGGFYATSRKTWANLLNGDKMFNINKDSFYFVEKENDYAILRRSFLHEKKATTQTNHKAEQKRLQYYNTIGKGKSLPIISLVKRNVLRFSLTSLFHNAVTMSVIKDKVIRRENNATISTQEST